LQVHGQELDEAFPVYEEFAGLLVHAEQLVVPPVLYVPMSQEEQVPLLFL